MRVLFLLLAVTSVLGQLRIAFSIISRGDASELGRSLTVVGANLNGNVAGTIPAHRDALSIGRAVGATLDMSDVLNVCINSGSIDDSTWIHAAAYSAIAYHAGDQRLATKLFAQSQ